MTYAGAIIFLYKVINGVETTACIEEYVIWSLTHMLLVTNLTYIYKTMQSAYKVTETLVYGYLSESTQLEKSNKYQHVYMFFYNICVLELWTKVTSALEG